MVGASTANSELLDGEEKSIYSTDQEFSVSSNIQSKTNFDLKTSDETTSILVDERIIGELMPDLEGKDLMNAGRNVIKRQDTLRHDTSYNEIEKLRNKQLAMSPLMILSGLFS